jgi:Cys-rich four helix bundle protein (predicted Tat secretion target)
MQRREFIAAIGTAAAFAGTSQAFAETESGDMHSAKYSALQKTAIHCVATGNDCLRHCFGMFAMKDTSMAGCAESVFQLVSACNTLAALAAINSTHTGHLAKVVEMICTDCKKECDKFATIDVCKACSESCQKCAEECRKTAA